MRNGGLILSGLLHLTHDHRRAGSWVCPTFVTPLPPDLAPPIAVELVELEDGEKAEDAPEPEAGAGRERPSRNPSPNRLSPPPDSPSQQAKLTPPDAPAPSRMPEPEPPRQSGASSRARTGARDRA